MREEWVRNWPQLCGRGESPTWSSLIKHGISLVSNPWHHASKAVLSGWISFLWSQVIQSVAVDVIVLVHSMRRERVHEGKEPGAEPCNGSSLLGPGMNLYRSKNAAQFLLTHPLHFASGS